MIRKQLLKTTTLSKQELRNINNLVDECHKNDGYRIRVYWNIVSDRQLPEFDDFLYYVDGKLVGYLGLFVFKEHEAELTVAIHPQHRHQGLFTRLYEEAILELKRRNIPNCMFICHADSTIAEAFIKKQHGTIDHTEIEMTLKRKASIDNLPSLTLRQVAEEDIDTLAKIDMACFGTNPDKIYFNFVQNLGSKDRKAWIATNEEGVDVGKLHIRFDTPGKAYIHDLCVLPEAQRKRYGASMVMNIAKLLRKQGCPHIYLDVLSDNEKAIKMYEKCGYDITTVFNLWKIEI